MRNFAFVPSRYDVFWLDSTFGMNYATWNDLLPWPADSSQVADYAALGGVFTSPPVAVSMNTQRVDVFGLGTDYALYHRYLESGTWSGAWESLGGSLMSPPAVLANSDGTGPRLDIFALGPDQSMLQLTWSNVAGWTSWTPLGGCFTTPPVALAGPNGRIDLLGRGPDGMLYMATCVGGTWSEWTYLGGPLLAAPVSASMPSALRWGTDNLDVFAVGSDGALWHIAFDGVRWHPWESLGGQFFSEPDAHLTMVSSLVHEGAGGVVGTPQTLARVAVNAHPRFDVFLVGPATDQPGGGRYLWRASQENAVWSLGQVGIGPLVGLPSIQALPTQDNSADGLTFRAVSPSVGGRLSAQQFNDTNINNYPDGPAYRTTTTYRFSMDRIAIDNTRAEIEDTDLVNATIVVERWPAQQVSQNIGSVDNGNYHPDQIKVDNFTVELCERVGCGYLVTNSGDLSKQQYLTATAAKGIEDWMNDVFKSSNLLKDAPVAGASLAGSALGVAFAIVLEQILSVGFSGADGVVAAENQTFNGRSLQGMVAASNTLTIETQHSGTDLPSFFSMPSFYTVTWSLTRI
jgi:hypothetical protein